MSLVVAGYPSCPRLPQPTRPHREVHHVASVDRGPGGHHADWVPRHEPGRLRLRSLLLTSTIHVLRHGQDPGGSGDRLCCTQTHTRSGHRALAWTNPGLRQGVNLRWQSCVISGTNVMQWIPAILCVWYRHGRGKLFGGVFVCCLSFYEHCFCDRYCGCHKMDSIESLGPSVICDVTNPWLYCVMRGQGDLWCHKSLTVLGHGGQFDLWCHQSLTVLCHEGPRWSVMSQIWKSDSVLCHGGGGGIYKWDLISITWKLGTRNIFVFSIFS